MRAWIVAGPTASGKSALAAWMAARLGGTVVNADSMQVYRELRVVTARPSLEEEAAVPHALYGVRSGAEPASAAWWRSEALGAMDAARRAGRVPVLCGGTGLYLQALTQGLSEIPDPGEAARHEARERLRVDGPLALHAALARVDPQTAARLRPTDAQRLARAWEVWRGTGRGLAEWQRGGDGPAGWDFSMVLLRPDRGKLRAALAARFAAMLAQGALDEVAALLASQLDPSVPILRAVGVPELAGALRGEWTLAEAAARAVLASGQLAKRQDTWLRNRPPVPPTSTHMIHARFAGLAQFSESVTCGLMTFIDTDHPGTA